MNKTECCVTCERNTKNYIQDDDPVDGTGWFYCEKCWDQNEKTLNMIYEQDYQERLEAERIEL